MQISSHSNGTKITKKLPARHEDWRQEKQVVTPAYKEPFLHEMVQLARELRLQNMAKEDILKEVIRQKSQMTVIPEVDDKCLMEQVGFFEYEDVFSTLVFNANKNQTF